MSPAKPRILAIDDVPANLLTLGAALAHEYTLQLASSGAMGLSLALQSPPDLILLDVMMPVMDGFETCRRLKAEPTLKDIPVVFITALENFDSEVEALAMGASDYLTKPINVTIARLRIHNLLEREQLRTVVEQQRNLLEAEGIKRQAMADALTRSKQQLVVAQSLAKTGSWHVVFGADEAQDRWTVSDEIRAIYEVPAALGITGDTGFAHIPEADRQFARLAWAAAKSGQGATAWRHRIDVHGRIKWMQVTSRFVFDSQGRALEASGTHQDITDLKCLEDARQDALDRLQKIADRVPGVVYEFRLRPDGSSCFPFISESCKGIFRVSPQDVCTDATRLFAAIHPDDREGVQCSIAKSAQQLDTWRHEYRVKFDDGAVRWMMGNGVPQREADGAVLWHGFVIDISEQKKAEAIFHGLFEQSVFLAGILDPQGRITDVNSKALSLTDLPREKIIGQYFPNTPWWSNSEDRSRLMDALRLAYQGTASSFEARHPNQSGDPISVLFSAMPITLDNGIQVAVVGVDITERKQLEDQVRQLAFYDTLTQLPNRRLLNDRLGQLMVASKRSASHCAVMVLDLDNFKALNDTQGHLVGDLLLVEAARRLSTCVREMDTVARFGGDEFVVLLSELDADKAVSIQQALGVAEKIRASLSELYQLQCAHEGQPELRIEHRCTASIGVVVFVNDAATQDDILQQADATMYQAKAAGRNQVRLHGHG